MILINLLPHREAARKRRRETFYATLGAVGRAGRPDRRRHLPLVRRPRSPTSSRKNTLLQAEIKKLEGQIKEISTLQDEIAALRARQQAVEDLQADRNLPVHLLNELVRQLPDGVYLTSMKQDNQVVTLHGMAQSNERVSELLRNLGNNSPWLITPELVEIIAGNVTLSPRDQRRVANFTMRVRLLRSSEAQKAGGAALRPASAPSAASSCAQAPALRDEDLTTMATRPPHPSSTWPRCSARIRSQFRGLNPERSVHLARAAALAVPAWRSWSRIVVGAVVRLAAPTPTTSSRPSAPRK